MPQGAVRRTIVVACHSIVWLGIGYEKNNSVLDAVPEAPLKLSMKDVLDAGPAEVNCTPAWYASVGGGE